MTYNNLDGLNLETGDFLRVNFETGLIENITKNTKINANPFSEVQLEIYNNNGLF